MIDDYQPIYSALMVRISPMTIFVVNSDYSHLSLAFFYYLPSMKSVVTFTLLSCFLFFSCKKPSSTVCHDPVTKVPCFVSLSGGFTTSDVDTVVLNRYLAGTSFSQLVESDTTISMDYTLRNDTIIDKRGTTNRGYFSFGSLSKGSDYEVLVPGAVRKYYISNITYNSGSDSTVTYITSGDCGGRALTIAPDSAKVGAQLIRMMPGAIVGESSYIFLSKF